MYLFVTFICYASKLKTNHTQRSTHKTCIPSHRYLFLTHFCLCTNLMTSLKIEYFFLPYGDLEVPCNVICTLTLNKMHKVTFSLIFNLCSNFFQCIFKKKKNNLKMWWKKNWSIFLIFFFCNTNIWYLRIELPEKTLFFNN